LSRTLNKSGSAQRGGAEKRLVAGPTAADPSREWLIAFVAAEE
jgi:hypothetical protein